MDDRSITERLIEELERPYHDQHRPTECPFCGADRIWWNGSRRRGAKVLFEERVVEVDSFVCRRLRCGDCRRSWTLLPDGLIPGREVGLFLAAKALEAYLFRQEQGLAGVAREHRISPRSLGRLRDWVCGLVSPTFCQGLIVERSGEPIVGRLLPVADLPRRMKYGASRTVLVGAARVLCLLESLAAAAGLASPGLATLVKRAVRGRSGLASYRAGIIPERAWRQAVGLPETMTM